MEHIYRTKGTCSREISFELDGDKVRNVHFVGGCDGNLKAVSKLVDGMSVTQIEALLRGNTCGPRSTSDCRRPPRFFFTASFFSAGTAGL